LPFLANAHAYFSSPSAPRQALLTDNGAAFRSRILGDPGGKRIDD
jgi:hypothetical protein